MTLKYEEIMDKVSVDSAMRNRILNNVAKRKRSYYFPTIAAAAVITAVAVGINVDFDSRPENTLKDNPPLTAEQSITTEPPVTTEPPITTKPPVMTEPQTLPQLPETTEPNITDRPPVTSRPPVTNTVQGISRFETLADLETAVGFEVEKPCIESESYKYSMYSDTLAEITAETADGNIVLRKSKGSADNSGDYNAYNNVETVNINDYEVIMKGSADGISLATWTDGEYAWSLTFENPVPADKITEIIRETMKAD